MNRWKRFKNRIPSLGLRTQAWMISFMLLILTSLLGAKAYSVAHTHYHDMTQLVRYDLATQVLLKEDGLERPLESFREEKLNQAHETALGLLRQIIGALLISTLITAWLLYLFFRGLITPLERLQKLDQAKTEFLAMVSHEIKNPLAALKEGLALLSGHGETLSPSARSKTFGACMIASKRLESMINNLLQHSRMEAGFFQRGMDFGDLQIALQTAIDEVRPLAEKRKISFELLAQEGVPMASFCSDGMIQVFENLFLNAIKYGSEGSAIEIRITRSSAPVPALAIEITNSGPGIDTADIDRVFDRFYRGSNSSSAGSRPVVSGMGMGLHVVKTIVEAHLGQVSVESRKNRTTFRVLLPLGKKSSSEKREERYGPQGLHLADR